MRHAGEIAEEFVKRLLRINPHREPPPHRVGLYLIAARRETVHSVFRKKRSQPNYRKVYPMAKKSRGGRMTAAKKRAAKSPGGKGPVKDRPAGKKIMKT